MTTAAEIDLAIGGMTCASCSSRIERKLNKIEGVEASVNLATERAHVRLPAGLAANDIIAVVHKTGYTAELLAAPPGSATTAMAGAPEPEPEPVVVTWTGIALARLRALLATGALAQRAAVAAVLTVPVVLIAMVPALGHALGGARPWIELLLSIPVVVWAAWPFHRAAAINARHGASTMDTLVSLGVVASFSWSLVATLRGSTDHMYYEVADVVTTFLLLGRLAESRAKARGKSALTSLLELGVKDVAVVRRDAGGRDTETRVPIEELAAGESFVVRPGEKIATDGVVLQGVSAVDTSLVTGESMPVEVQPGDEVTGGTINAHGRLLVRATRVGAQTTLAGITRLVETAQTGKAPIQRLADRVSAVFVPTVIALALATFVGWLATGRGAAAALSAAVTVLVVACPCALGLATPTALLAGTGRGAEIGVLIKGLDVLESTRRIDTVVLDKTGTVTSGHTRLVAIRTAGRLTQDAALAAAAAVETGSEHPLARAIVDAARERSLELKAIDDFVNLAGNGARATIRGTEVTVGKAELFDLVPDELTAPTMPSMPTTATMPTAPTAPTMPGAPSEPGAAVGTVVYVGWGGRARAALSIADEVRPTAAAGVRRLTDLGLAVHLLTGDNAATATAVAAQVGIPADRVRAHVLPADKYAVVGDLQRSGRVVAMVGDGVNDAAALAAADLGLAMGSGTDVAIDSADIVLMRSDVTAVADAIELSRRTLTLIKQNLFWAFGYNALMIPLAMFGVLNPLFAGAAMAFSSVFVVTNSLRLRRFGGSGRRDERVSGEPARGTVEADHSRP